MESKNIKELGKQEFSNVRILVDLPEYDIEKDTRLLIPFSYYQHYGLMNRNGDVVVEPKFDRILDSCHNSSDVIRVGLHYTYGFNMATKGPSTYLGTKWGLIDSDGNSILEPNYKGIGVSDDKKILTLRHMIKNGALLMPVVILYCRCCIPTYGTSLERNASGLLLKQLMSMATNESVVLI